MTKTGTPGLTKVSSPTLEEKMSLLDLDKRRQSKEMSPGFRRISTGAAENNANNDNMMSRNNAENRKRGTGS